MLHKKCTDNTQTWVELLTFLLQGYIGVCFALTELDQAISADENETQLSTNGEKLTSKG
jgi:hypothetical protein